MNESEVNLPTDDDDLPFVVKGRKRHLPPPEAPKPPQSPQPQSRTGCTTQAINGAQANRAPLSRCNAPVMTSQPSGAAQTGRSAAMAEQTDSPERTTANDKQSKVTATTTQQSKMATAAEQPPKTTATAAEQPPKTTATAAEQPPKTTATAAEQPPKTTATAAEQPPKTTATAAEQPPKATATAAEQPPKATATAAEQPPKATARRAEPQRLESRSAGQDIAKEDFDEDDDDDAALFIPTDEESSDEIASPLQSSTGGGVSCTASSSRRALNTSASQKRPSRKRKKNTSSEDEDDASSSGSAAEHLVLSARVRDKKGNLIAQILARWWYCMDPWPPAGFDYEAELHRRKLKQVSFDAWEDEDDVDAQNFTKVYEITHFPGMYRDPKGNVVDLRPQEGKPCFANLAKLSENDLIEMLGKALQNQIKALDNSPYKLTDDPVVRQLQDELRRELRNLSLAARTTTGRGKPS